MDKSYFTSPSSVQGAKMSLRVIEGVDFVGYNGFAARFRGVV